VGTLYWSIVSLAVGGCIGSFLNVVVYRWPLGLSVRRPTRSFCPSCRADIVWYDNVPVISYLLLRGRCRNCRTGISLQYPLVELVTAFVFLLTYDALFVAQLRNGIGDLGVDWPMLLAHWALFAGLIALAVMDLEAYMVDIRVTWFILAAGLVGHLFWTPPASAEWLRPGWALSAFAFAITVGLAGAVWLATRLHGRENSAEADLPSLGDALGSETIEQGDEKTSPPPSASGLYWVSLLVPAGLVAAYVVSMQVLGAGQAYLIADEFGGLHVEYGVGAARVGAGLLVVYLALTLAASRPQPEADAEIVETIDSEAPDARRMAWWELKWLSPAIGLGILAVVAVTRWPAASAAVAGVLEWSPTGGWKPLWGLSTALSGWVVAGAIGWGTRIGFTLIRGKEAFGMGDVHILAAAGAVAGWLVALFGFFLAAVLALLALIIIHLRRQSAMLPYGPWLGLGFFLGALFQDLIVQYLNLDWLLP
jgi:leader peptidase (prepilin peptidase)/N-methyltransferase